MTVTTASPPDTLRATGVRLEKDRLRFRLNADADAPRADLWRRFDRFEGVVIAAEGDWTAVVG